jgi:rubrerythrin
MDILEQAMTIEEEGERLYRSFAQQASDKGAVYIFTRLADQERQHYGVFQKMKKNFPVTAEKVGDLQSLRDIFLGWKKHRVRLDGKPSQIELYRKALDMEERSIQVYEDSANAATDDKVKTVFLRIAEEEKRHRKIMENIIEFVTKPDTWAENAEFGYQGEEYYL